MTEVRRATIDDAEAINKVYNPYISESAATFETDPISLVDRMQWIEARSANARHDVFVSMDEKGDIRGFANAGPFDERRAYEVSVKVSVFLQMGHESKGMGSALYTALFASLAEKDVHRAYALIVAPNPGSKALHERFGFRQISVLSEVGRKFGDYYDVMWFEKRFD